MRWKQILINYNIYLFIISSKLNEVNRKPRLDERLIDYRKKSQSMANYWQEVNI